MLDSNIALGFKGMQLTDPMEHMNNAMSLSNMGMQNQFMQSKMDEQNRLSALTQRRQQAFADSGGDPAKFRQSLVDMGMYDDVQAHDKSALETEKTRGEIDHKAAETNSRLQKLVSGVATGIHAGGTIEHAMHGSSLLRQYGAHKQADIVDSWLEKNPEATPDMIRQAVSPYIASELDSKSVLMPDFKDAGGQLVNVNPNTQFAPINKTQTPESIASNQTAVRGQNMADARSRDANSIASKPPAGYRYTADGNMEAIPGGPADAKNDATAKALELRTKSQTAKAGIVIGKIDDALKKTGFMTTGFIGKGLSFVPGTDAYDLDKTVDTIKANIGFQELADMRAASPTGGALGQVAVKELEFLQAALGQLDVGQSEGQQRKHLMDIKRHYGQWKKAVDQSNKEGNGKSNDGWTDL